MARLNVVATSAKKSSEDLQRQIQTKAYELYLKRGCTHGNNWADWFEAEKIVKASK